jgi:AbrB family looped-hinge helix DNA binding protein
MTTTVTVKGKVTLPKAVREAVGLKPGDKVDVHATASGGVREAGRRGCVPSASRSLGQAPTCSRRNDDRRVHGVQPRRTADLSAAEDVTLVDTNVLLDILARLAARRGCSATTPRTA